MSAANGVAEGIDAATGRFATGSICRTDCRNAGTRLGRRGSHDSLLVHTYGIAEIVRAATDRFGRKNRLRQEQRD